MTTDPQNELLTQVDQNNKVMGSVQRAVAHSTPGIYYRTIYVLIKNDKGEILLQKRSSTKDLFPNCWDLSVGGHVVFGQSFKDTAIRELHEELNLKVNTKDLTFRGEVLVKLPSSNEYFHVFEYQLKPHQKITAAKDEVSNTKWLRIEKIKKTMKEKSLKWYPRPEQVIPALY